MVERLKRKKADLEKEAETYRDKIDTFEELLDKTETKIAVIDELIFEEESVLI